MAAGYSVAWMCSYFPIKYLPSVWRAHTTFATYDIVMNSCGHTSFIHGQILLNHLLPDIYMTKKNFVEAIISDGVSVILLRKPQKNNCSTCGHFFRGDDFCDCLIFSFSWINRIWTCFAPHQWIITWGRCWKHHISSNNFSKEMTRIELLTDSPWILPCVIWQPMSSTFKAILWCHFLGTTRTYRATIGGMKLFLTGSRKLKLPWNTCRKR